MNKNQPWDILRFIGTGSWNSITHKVTTDVEEAGIVDGVPSVYFTTTNNHNLTVGSAIVLDGSVNYDDTYLTLTGTTAKLIYVPARYVEEELTTSHTFMLTLAPKQAFEFGGFKLTLSAAGGTAAEDMTITVDAGANEDYDYQLYSQDMETVRYLNWNIQDNPEPFEKGDELDFAWANGNTREYGLEVYWRRR